MTRVRSWIRVRVMRLLLLACVLPAAIPAEAVHAPQESIADRTDSADYVSYRLTLPPGISDFTVRINASSRAATTAAMGIWLMNGDGTPRATLTITAFAGEESVFVSAPEPVGVVVSDWNVMDDGEWTGGAWIGLGNVRGPAEYVVAMMAASDVAGSTTLRSEVTGTSGVTVTNETAGEGAFMRRERDFAGTHARHTSGGFGVNASALAFTEVLSANRLFATFGTFDGAAILTRSGPSGPEVRVELPGRPAFFNTNNGPPGEYDFHVGAYAEAPIPALYLWGASVELA